MLTLNSTVKLRAQVKVLLTLLRLAAIVTVGLITSWSTASWGGGVPTGSGSTTFPTKGAAYQACLAKEPASSQKGCSFSFGYDCSENTHGGSPVAQHGGLAGHFSLYKQGGGSCHYVFLTGTPCGVAGGTWSESEKRCVGGGKKDAGGADPNMCPVSNPIHPGTGNKFQRESDYTGVGTFPLSFTRYYNSSTDDGIDGLGLKWRHSYMRHLDKIYDLKSSDEILARRPDGKVLHYQVIKSDNSVRVDADVLEKLVVVVDSGTGQTTGYTLTTAGGLVEHYNVDGRLESIVNTAGLTQTLAYNATTGFLETVTDPRGRTLTFAYDTNDRLETVTTPKQEIITLGYTGDNLTTVTYPGTPTETRTYHYENATYPNHLTGVTNENNERYITWGYDTEGRAISGTKAGGFDNYALNFTGTTAEVTDPGGNTSIYDLVDQWGRTRASSIDRPCLGCTGQRSGYTFDDNGYLASGFDFSGNETRYEHNLEGLQTCRIEAYGSNVARLTHTTWDTTLRKVTQRDIYRPTQGANLTPATCQAAITSWFHIKQTSYTYVDGNLTSMTETDPVRAESRTTTYGYHPVYKTLETVDGARTGINDTTTVLYYDTATTDYQPGDIKEVQVVVDADTTLITKYLKYDANGRATEIEHPSGAIERRTYDPRGRLVTSEHEDAALPLTLTTTYEYYPNGQVESVTLPEGETTTFVYNDAEMLERINHPNGDYTKYEYHPSGLQQFVKTFNASDVLTREVEYDHDDLGHVDAITTGGGTSTSNFNLDGDMTASTSPRGHTTDYEHDELNRPIVIIDPQTPERGRTELIYDALDNLTVVNDSGGTVSAFDFDAFGQMRGEWGEDAGTRTYGYDNASNLISESKHLTGVTYLYDEGNRITKETHTVSPTVEVVDYTYDEESGKNGIGRLTTIDESSGKTEYFYDVFGRVTEDKRTLGTVAYSTLYTYDGNSRVETMTYPNGDIVTYDYDADGLLDRVLLNGTELAKNIEHLPFGPIESFEYGNGLIRDVDYDTAYRVTQIQVGTTASPDSLMHLSYGYDASGNITGITDHKDALQNLDFTDGYDPLDRLVKVVGPFGEIAYSYDKNGNRSEASATTAQPDLDAAALDPDTWERAYTPRGRLESVKENATTVAEYEYNALGQRTKKTVGATVTYFGYDLGGRLLWEKTGSEWRNYVSMEGEFLATHDNGTTQVTTYLHNDHLMTPKLATNGGGTSVWKSEALPFGKATRTSLGGSSYSLALSFPGQYIDDETGWHYNYFRHYDPSVGRYTKSDPIGLAGGLNRFAYVAGNPLTAMDPLGLAVRYVTRTVTQHFDSMLEAQRFIHFSCKNADSVVTEEVDHPEGFTKIFIVTCVFIYEESVRDQGSGVLRLFDRIRGSDGPKYAPSSTGPRAEMCLDQERV